MRVVVARDGRSTAVEVAPGADQVTVAGRSYPVTVVRRTATLVELEIAGERVVVDGWPEHFSEPPGPVDVNGERAPVTIQRETGASATPTPRASSLPAAPAAPVGPPAASAAPAGGLAIVPPMPGKVIELRVAEGQRVKKGEVLLVLEAMKMRNELASPTDGTVRDVRARPGANARAKEALLFVVPD
jgi:glutaconyl-CoA/methylmalonyl-CoA decarboxylase subunit gamma